MVDMNLPQLVAEFGSEDKCRDYLVALRWPDGPRCPRCQSEKVSRIVARHQFDCDSCRYQFSVTAGTIFHDSHLPLWKWLLAVYMVAESKKGISANQVARTLKVSYKTAWYLCHRIRAAMKDANPRKLDGIVEVDETYVGGKRRGVGRGRKIGKVVVIGAADRDDHEIKVRVIPSAKKKHLRGFIRAETDPDAVIYTDENRSYRDLPLEGHRHETVEHGAGEYVRADVHTNTIESVWSLFKRSLVGSYHQLSTKHLPAYLDEMTFRFNNRHNPFLFRDTVFKLLEAKALPYSTLVTVNQ